jgi:hypothetical protein
VVNEAFVRENFPDQDVLGAGVRVGVAFGAGKTWRVVGVAGDVRRALAAEVTPEIYVPLAQADTDEKWVIEDLRRQLGDATVHVRSLAKADRLLPAVRDQIAPRRSRSASRSERTIRSSSGSFSGKQSHPRPGASRWDSPQRSRPLRSSNRSSSR